MCMTTDGSAGHKLRGQAGAAIEVTSKMIEAGVLAAREHCLGAPLADLVTRVYLAMALEAEPQEILLRLQAPEGTP
jgi:hypothetical protein